MALELLGKDTAVATDIVQTQVAVVVVEEPVLLEQQQPVLLVEQEVLELPRLLLERP